jgi:TnpA family transposase
LRRRCYAGLNKGEQRHSLAKVIYTFKEDRIADCGANFGVSDRRFRLKAAGGFG